MTYSERRTIHITPTATAAEVKEAETRQHLIDLFSEKNEYRKDGSFSSDQYYTSIDQYCLFGPIESFLN
jgi:hypothetical protein